MPWVQPSNDKKEKEKKEKNPEVLRGYKKATTLIPLSTLNSCIHVLKDLPKITSKSSNQEGVFVKELRNLFWSSPSRLGLWCTTLSACPVCQRAQKIPLSRAPGLLPWKQKQMGMSYLSLTEAIPRAAAWLPKAKMITGTIQVSPFQQCKIRGHV